MAFVTLEDLYGTVEIIVFPTIYQNVKPYLIEDNGLYVKGRASVSEESGKLIAEYIVPIDQIPKEVWIPTYENISAKNDVFSELKSLFGEKNVKVREKSIEKSQKKR